MKKVGNAVSRNLIKRRMREICKENYIKGIDIIFVFKDSKVKLTTFQELKSEYLKVRNKIKCLIN